MMSRFLPALLVMILLSGCSDPSTSDPATSAETPDGLEVLELSTNQADEIRRWLESQEQTPPDPADYAEFVDSVLNLSQKKRFKILVGQDGEQIATLKLERIQAAAEQYKSDCGKYPAKAEDLATDPGISGWAGPYFREFIDPWGIPFQLQEVEGGLEIRTWGPDREPNTEDDLVL